MEIFITILIAVNTVVTLIAIKAINSYRREFKKYQDYYDSEEFLGF